MVQLLATVLFFIVFIELLIATSIYIGLAIYRFYKERKPVPPPEKEEIP